MKILIIPLSFPVALLQGQEVEVNRPNIYLQNIVYKKVPYSQQCPAKDGGGFLVFHGVGLAWEIR